MPLALAAVLLLACALPAQADSPDPLVDFLQSHAAPSAGARDKSPEGTRLSEVESVFATLARGLESYRAPRHYERIKPHLVAGMEDSAKPFFETREKALNAAYRTLAVIDYTWAERAGEAPCDARGRRAALIEAADGLFARGGKPDPWIAAALSIGSPGRAAAPIDAAKSAPRDLELARAYALTAELAGDLPPQTRQGDLCERAQLYERLASSALETAPIAAGRRFGDSAAAVLLLRHEGRVGAATLVRTDKGIVAVTAASLAGQGTVTLYAEDGSTHAATVARRDGRAGLAELTLDEAYDGPALEDSAEPRADSSVEAIGHPLSAGPWSRTRGLVQSVSNDGFAADSLFDVGLLGGAVFDEGGAWVGVAVEPVGAAVRADGVKRWLSGAPIAAAVEPQDRGTGAVVTEARLDVLDDFAAGGSAPTVAWREAPVDAAVFIAPPEAHASCVAYCGGGGGAGWAGANDFHWEYNPNSYGAILGRAMRAQFDQGIAWLASLPGQAYRKLKSAISEAADDSRTRRAARATAVAQESKPEKKSPLEPIGLRLTIEPSAPEDGKPFTIIAQVIFKGEEGSKSGIELSVRVSPADKLAQLSPAQPTDSAGRAVFTAATKPDLVAQAREQVRSRADSAQNELEAEERNASAADADADGPTRDSPQGSSAGVAKAGRSLTAARENASAKADASVPVRFLLTVTATSGAGFSAQKDVPVLAQACPPGTTAAAPDDGGGVATPWKIAETSLDPHKRDARCRAFDALAEQNGCGITAAACRKWLAERTPYKSDPCLVTVRPTSASSPGLVTPKGSPRSVVCRPTRSAEDSTGSENNGERPLARDDTESEDEGSSSAGEGPNKGSSRYKILVNKLDRILNELAAGDDRGVSGTVTDDEADFLGRRFVGEGAIESTGSKGEKILRSRDGLRQYRLC